LGSLVLAGGGTWAVLELVVWNRLPHKLVGKWIVVEGQMEGTTMEFRRDGSLVARRPQGDWETVLKAQVTVEDRTMVVKSQNNRTGQEEIAIHFIRALGQSEMVLEDERGQRLKLHHVTE
jgi:hypothetical protein